MADTIIVRFDFRDCESLRTRYTQEAFDANAHLLSYLAKNDVVTVEADTGRSDVVDLTSNNDFSDVFEKEI